MGDITGRFIKDQSYYKNTKGEKEWMFAAFPITGKESEFITFRRKLADYIDGIDINPVSEDIPPTISYQLKGKISKHAAFELAGIKRWIEKIFSGDLLNERDYDDKWFNKYVIPHFAVQSVVALSCSYFEENIKLLLYSHGFNRDRFTRRLLYRDKNVIKNLTINELLGLLLKVRGKEHVTWGDRDLIMDIKKLQNLRNAFIHDGAFLDKPYLTINQDDYFPSLKGGYNRIELGKGDIEKIIELMGRFVEMLDKIEKLDSKRKRKVAY